VLVERRPRPRLIAQAWIVTVRPQVPAAYTPSAGGTSRSAPRRCASGSRASRPRLSPVTTGPRASKRCPSRRGRHVDLAAGQRPPDGRRADRLVDAVRPVDEADRLDLEVDSGPAPAAAATLPSRWRPKWKSSPTTTALVASALTSTSCTKSWADSRPGLSKVSTTVASRPVSPSSSSRVGRSVRRRGADSGRTTLAGWRSKVTTTLSASERRPPAAAPARRPRS
jgi:hypothetical protein